MSGPLDGLVVADFTHHVAGPACTKLLADYGARVIKIEPPGGDPVRAIPPFWRDDPAPDHGALYLHLNTSKQSIVLDLATTEGRADARRIVDAADIVVENFRPGVMNRFGLDYPQVAAGHPQLVYLSITNFGQDGPDRNQQATDLIFLARSEYLFITGEPQRAPLRFYGYQAQYHAGIDGAVAVLGAWWWAASTGEGQHIDLSILESQTVITERQFQRFPFNGDIRQRIGHWGENYPWSVYPCADGWIACYSNNAEQWRKIARLLGRPDLENLAGAGQRLARREELDVALLEWLRPRGRMQAFHEAQAADIPWVALHNPADLLADPQLRARDALVGLDHPAVGHVILPGPPARLEATPGELRPAPRLDEHGAAIAAEFGLAR